MPVEDHAGALRAILLDCAEELKNEQVGEPVCRSHSTTTIGH
jgi:hypothetical protein